MKKNVVSISSILIVLSLILMGCGASAFLPEKVVNLVNSPAQVIAQQVAPTSTPQAVPTVQTPASNQPTASGQTGLLAAYEGTLESIYSQVSPSVVNISVVQDNSGTNNQGGGFTNPNSPQSQTPQFSQGEGSGFVWDLQGHIVTNNHVVDGATQITVFFSDGSSVPATVVGTDPSSDLAVVKVDVPAAQLHPVTMGDSNQVKVGQIAIAIGNPFGLNGSMTVGIISALSRSLPSNEAATNGPTYSIPDIIQTDAPINPGNSGGVLVDDQGKVVGVTSAIESPVQANAGIGFAIPAAIVTKVIPALISNGHYDHPYLGLSGISLTPDLAKAMNLTAGQRGALVEEVIPGGPVDKAGIKASATTATILGQDVRVGGDVITKINGTVINSMDDVIAYLNDQTEVGQKITVTFLRDGKEQTAEVTLAARPASVAATTTNPNTNNSGNSGGTGAWLGIAAVTVSSDIAQAMNLDQNTQGVLIEQVQSGSPAETAGLKAGTQAFTSNGQRILLGGDIITKMDSTNITSIEDLPAFVQQATVGQNVSMTVLRGRSSVDVKVTLGSKP